MPLTVGLNKCVVPGEGRRPESAVDVHWSNYQQLGCPSCLSVVQSSHCPHAKMDSEDVGCPSMDLRAPHACADEQRSTYV